jgi:hypothetical protein
VFFLKSAAVFLGKKDMPSGHVKKGAILHSSINRIYTIGGASLKNKFLKAPSERQNVLARLAILM